MDQDPAEYVLYLRKSNGRKAVPRQRAITGKHIADHGGVIIAEFVDDDRTAWNGQGERPGRDDFDKMIALLKSRKGLRVAAWHADRLTRNDYDTGELIRVCKANGHVVETPTGAVYNVGTPTGAKQFRDAASDAIYEVDHLQERVLAGRDEVAAEGRWLGGKRPFGWELDEHPLGADGKPLLDEDGKPVNGMLRLVDAEAAAIRQACAAVLSGAAVSAIARQWNAAGITGTLGAQWTGEAVRRALVRPRNAGLMEHRGQVTGKASWPAIVDEPTWRAVCAVLTDPRRKTTPGPARQHLLSGIARCGTCGGPMICSTTGPSRGKRAVYRCRRGVEGVSGHVARDAATLDAYIAAVVIERLSRPDAKKLLLHKRESDLPDLYRRKAELETAMQASNGLRRDGLLTPAEFADERREHQRQAAELAAKVTAAEQADVLAPAVRDPAGTWKAADLGQRRAIVDALMSITVHPQPKGRTKGWKPGDPYFDPEIINRGIEWKRGA